MRELAIQRKAFISRHIHDNTHYVSGALSKGKVHCGCGCCSEKSHRVSVNRHSYSTNSRTFLSRRDLQALAKAASF